jgi:hypothetical protein
MKRLLPKFDAKTMPEWCTPEEVARLTGLSLREVMAIIKRHGVETRRDVPKCKPRKVAAHV